MSAGVEGGRPPGGDGTVSSSGVAAAEAFAEAAAARRAAEQTGARGGGGSAGEARSPGMGRASLRLPGAYHFKCMAGHSEDAAARRTRLTKEAAEAKAELLKSLRVGGATNWRDLGSLQRLFSVVNEDGVTGLSREEFVGLFTRDDGLLHGPFRSGVDPSYIFSRLLELNPADNRGCVDWDAFSTFLVSCEEVFESHDVVAGPLYPSDGCKTRVKDKARHHKTSIATITPHPDFDRYFTAATDGIVKSWCSLTLEYETTVFDPGTVAVVVCGLIVMPHNGSLIVCRNDRCLHMYACSYEGTSLLRTFMSATFLQRGLQTRTYSVGENPFDCNIDVEGRITSSKDLSHRVNRFMLVQKRRTQLYCAIPAMTDIFTAVCSLRFGAQDNDIVALGTDAGRVLVLGLNWTEPVVSTILAVKPHQATITSISCLVDRRCLLTSSLDNTIKVLNVDKQTVVTSIVPGLKGSITLGPGDPEPEAESPQSPKRREGSEACSYGGGVLSLAYDTSLQMSASACGSNKVRLGSLLAPGVLELTEHRGVVTDILWLEDKHPESNKAWHKRITYLVTLSSADKTVKVWETANFRCLQSITDKRTCVGAEDRLRGLAYDPRTKRLLVGASSHLVAYKVALPKSAARGYARRNGAFLSTDAPEGAERVEMQTIRFLVYEPSSSSLVGCDSRRVAVWNMATGAVSSFFDIPGGGVTAVTLLPPQEQQVLLLAASSPRRGTSSSSSAFAAAAATAAAAAGNGGGSGGNSSPPPALSLWDCMFGVRLRDFACHLVHPPQPLAGAQPHPQRQQQQRQRQQRPSPSRSGGGRASLSAHGGSVSLVPAERRRPKHALGAHPAVLGCVAACGCDVFGGGAGAVYVWRMAQAGAVGGGGGQQQSGEPPLVPVAQTLRIASRGRVTHITWTGVSGFAASMADGSVVLYRSGPDAAADASAAAAAAAAATNLSLYEVHAAFNVASLTSGPTRAQTPSLVAPSTPPLLPSQAASATAPNRSSSAAEVVAAAAAAAAAAAGAGAGASGTSSTRPSLYTVRGRVLRRIVRKALPWAKARFVAKCLIAARRALPLAPVFVSQDVVLASAADRLVAVYRSGVPTSHFPACASDTAVLTAMAAARRPKEAAATLLCGDSDGVVSIFDISTLTGDDTPSPDPHAAPQAAAAAAASRGGGTADATEMRWRARPTRRRSQCGGGGGGGSPRDGKEDGGGSDGSSPRLPRLSVPQGGDGGVPRDEGVRLCVCFKAFACPVASVVPVVPKAELAAVMSVSGEIKLYRKTGVVVTTVEALTSQVAWPIKLSPRGTAIIKFNPEAAASDGARCDVRSHAINREAPFVLTHTGAASLQKSQRAGPQAGSPAARSTPTLPPLDAATGMLPAAAALAPARGFGVLASLSAGADGDGGHHPHHPLRKHRSHPKARPNKRDGKQSALARARRLGGDGSGDGGGIVEVRRPRLNEHQNGGATDEVAALAAQPPSVEKMNMKPVLAPLWSEPPVGAPLPSLPTELLP